VGDCILAGSDAELLSEYWFGDVKSD
jgi:hypothetical protein